MITGRYPRFLSIWEWFKYYIFLLFACKNMHNISINTGQNILWLFCITHIHILYVRYYMLICCKRCKFEFLYITILSPFFQIADWNTLAAAIWCLMAETLLPGCWEYYENRKYPERCICSDNSKDVLSAAHNLSMNTVSAAHNLAMQTESKHSECCSQSESKHSECCS